MRNIARLALAVVVLTMSVPATRAGVIVYSTPGAVQPDENLHFNKPGLLDNSNPITGATNKTGFIFDIKSDQTLTTPSGGQARVEAQDGAFAFATGGNPAEIIQDVRQIRVSGLSVADDITSTGTTSLHTPEPASLLIWSMVAAGGAGTYWLRRRRSKFAAAA